MDIVITSRGTLLLWYLTFQSQECSKSYCQRNGFAVGNSPSKWPLEAVDPTWWEWKTEVAYRATGDHINQLELRAVLSALKWRTRKQGSLHQIGLHLIDSQVCLLALAKGRSTSRPLNGLLRRVGAVKLASSRSSVYAHCKSKLNPADAPSRKIPVKKLTNRVYRKRDGKKSGTN